MNMLGKISSSNLGDKFQFPSRGIAAACIMPTVVYIFIYGQSSHVVYFLVVILLLRAVMHFDVLYELKPSVLARSPPTPKLSPSGTPMRTLLTKSSKLSLSRSRNSVHSYKVPPATCIKSTDCPITKIRRGIVNKVSPEKLDDLIDKILATFNIYSREEIIRKDIEEFLILVFAAASRQPEYVSVFIEFMKRICYQILGSQGSEDILVNQAKAHWSAVCLLSVEKTKGWELMTVDDQLDARSRHRSKQLAIAEMCGQLASEGLIPPAYPLSWIEALLRPIQTCFQTNKIAQSTSLDSAMEIICCTIRGLGLCEAANTFTDIDQSRFESLCDSLTRLPLTSSRSKCIIKDLNDLRNNGWTKSSNWKQDRVPHKRVSM